MLAKHTRTTVESQLIRGRISNIRPEMISLFFKLHTLLQHSGFTYACNGPSASVDVRQRRLDILPVGDQVALQNDFLGDNLVRLDKIA
jgi:hypothetical protein